MSTIKRQKLCSVVTLVKNERSTFEESKNLKRKSFIASDDKCFEESTVFTRLSFDNESNNNLSYESKPKRKSNDRLDERSDVLLNSFDSTVHLSDFENNNVSERSTSKWSKIKAFEDLKIEPIESFDQLDLSKSLLDALESFDGPNEMQKKILPLLLKRKNDVFIQTEPYQNEVLSFLIAAIEKIDTNLKGSQVLILSPTLEVTLKTVRLAKELTKYNNKITIKEIIHDNRRNCFFNEHILIGNISTIIFSLNRYRSFDVKKINLVIFHEFDLVLGTDRFIFYAEELLRRFKSTCRFQVFTTCFGDLSFNFIERFSEDLVYLKALDIENCFANLFQFYCDCSTYGDKYTSLVNLLRERELTKVMVYTIGQENAFELKRRLNYDDFNVLLLTGQLSTDDRLKAMDKFRTSTKENILILNYPLNIAIENQASLVILYDIPVLSKNFYQEYFYSISKCVIRDRPGFIVNLFDYRTRTHLKDLENYFKIKLIKLDALDLS